MRTTDNESGTSSPDPLRGPVDFSEAEFAELVDGMVADSAPRLLAVVQEYGQRADAAIVAWCMEFEEHAEIIGINGGPRLKVRDPDAALPVFAKAPHVTAKLVPINPDAPSLYEMEA